MNGYGIEDPGFALLREVAQKYCPEELQAERQEVIPDESLNLEALAFLYDALPKHQTEQPSSLPNDDGFGIGIP